MEFSSGNKQAMKKYRWDFKTDIKMIWLPLAGYALFLIYVILFKKLCYASYLDERDGFVYIGNNILYYFQFIVSFFVIVISSFMFRETYRSAANSFIRTLPLQFHQIWTLRYLKLLAALFIVLIPAVFIGTSQVNIGIAEFIETFHLNIENAILRPWLVLLNCLISANFFLLLTQLFLIVTKNCIIADAFLFFYCIFETGPLHNYAGKFDIFYGCFSSFPIYPVIFVNFFIMAAASIILWILVSIWYKIILI